MPRLTKILLLALILAAVVALPVGAIMTPVTSTAYVTVPTTNDTWTYKEYNNTELNYTPINIDPARFATHYEAMNTTGWDYTPTDSATISKMQTVIDLLEQQNKLIAEQNALLANQTITGRKLKCTYYVNGVGACGEWTVT